MLKAVWSILLLSYAGKGMDTTLPGSRSKKKKPVNPPKKQRTVDQYLASNYKPIMTEEEKGVAEMSLKNVSAADLHNNEVMEQLYLDSRVYQRHVIEEMSLTNQLKKFPWLKEVS